jgi:DNA-binding MarR family transcriptional regulator
VYSRYLIGKARHFLLKARQKELNPYNISARQARILDIIQNIGHSVTLAELARYTDRGVSSLSVQLTRMEKDGLVKKTRKTLKSNLLCFELTAKGLDTYKHSSEMNAEKTIMSVLSEKERQQLISLLKRIISTAKKEVAADEIDDS